MHDRGLKELARVLPIFCGNRASFRPDLIAIRIVTFGRERDVKSNKELIKAGIGAE